MPGAEGPADGLAGRGNGYQCGLDWGRSGTPKRPWKVIGHFLLLLRYINR